MPKTRIEFSDSLPDMIFKMSDGNPGAVKVLIELINNPQIDPDDALKEFGSMLLLDSFGIYGSDIWVLYKDICKEDIVKMKAVLRSAQLGFFSGRVIQEASHNQCNLGDFFIPVDDLYIKVKERLPNFNNQ